VFIFIVYALGQTNEVLLCAMPYGKLIQTRLSSLWFLDCIWSYVTLTN